MFPGPNAQVYYNEAGEPLGWDYPSYDEPDYDREPTAAEYAWEDAYNFAQDEGELEDHDACRFADYRIKHGKGITTEHAWRNWVEIQEAKLT